MSRHFNRRATVRAGLAFILAALVASPSSALSPTGPLNLSTSPLVNSSTTSVQPNIMFTLDDSGSMAWDFVPDWAGSASGVATSYNTYTSAAGKPYIYHNAQYNGVAYDPSVTYTPPSYFLSSGAPDATDSTATYPSMTGTTSSTGADTSTTPNWNRVKNDGYGKQSTGTVALTSTQVTTSNSNVQDNYLYNIPYYFTFIPGEYCSDQKQTTCVTQNAASTSYPYPAYLRWCKSKALTTCQLLYSETNGYYYPRWPGMGTTTATITIGAGGTNQSITGITVNGYQIMSAATSASNNNGTIATRLAAVINCQYSMTGTCQTPGYTATVNSSTVTITSPSTGVTFTPVVTFSGGTAPVVTAFTTGTASINGQSVSTPGKNIFVPILPGYTYAYPGTSSKSPTRTDCGNASVCSYVQEMTNYANWYAYYHTRMQAMKTAVSQAFSTVGTNFRVGFNQISNQTGVTNGSKFLNPVTFNGTAKNTWYNMFFGINPSGSTPLRVAVSKIGRFYANKLSGQTDPMQYSCQQNFSILSTDGYWNDTTNPVQLNGTTAVGDQDGGKTPLPQYEGSIASSNSLADVAMYYYATDLRVPTGTNTTCPNSSGVDLCANNVFTSASDPNSAQHVTQFTLGLGVNGLLHYTPDYQTATSGDYYNLKNGFANTTWGDPIGNTSEGRVDDLWHAAVNGRGIYFSAKNPTDILYGFTTALNAIQAVRGAGTGAATSTLNPVPGNNFAYVPSYTTVQWTGNLEERAIDLATGTPVTTDTWCAENVVASTACQSPGVVQSSSASTANGTTTVYNCVTANATSCPNGTLDSSNNCIVPMTTSCTGKMGALVGPFTDTRTIYMSNGSSSPTLTAFTYANMSSTQQAYFSANYLSSRLSQWINYSTTNQADAVGTNLVNFLRGQNGYENRTENTEILYRARSATLGDIVNSRPTYVGTPPFAYSDTGYSAYVTAQTSRTPMLYVGANDGMLHAFNANTGVEQWAFVPTAVIPNMWELADMQYSNRHAYFVDGSVATGDVYDGSNWHTILVGGLGAGGRSYYALDITNPATPKLLWEIDASQEPNLGYTYGQPVITKNSNGTWVVLFSSGYNNINPGSGGGYLFVRNALTGAAISTIADNTGTISVPSGLAKIAGWADNGNVNNTTQYVYGGDLMGNLWRFDINAGSSFLLAVLKDPNGNTQPITTVPNLGLINTRKVVFIGTGKYLETSDLPDTQRQSYYAIEDNGATTTLNNPRTSPLMVQQTTAYSTSTNEYTISNNTVNFFSGRGWFFDFPTAGERVIVDPLLVNGTLTIASIIPSSTACAPGGFSRLYNLNYTTGAGVSTTYTASPIMGLNYYILNNQVQYAVTTADGNFSKGKGGGSPLSGTFNSSRVMWRELLTR